VKRLLLAVLLVFASAAPAHAASGDGALDGSELSVELEVSVPGSGTTSYGPNDPGAPSPIRVVMELVDTSFSSPAPDFFCGQPGDGLGWNYRMTVIDNATGAVISSTFVCVPIEIPGTEPVAPAVPQPPTIAEIWGAVTLPAPAIAVSPANEGVVGLDTWLWSGGATDAQIAVSLGGYTVTGTAHVTEYRFDAGDGRLSSAVSSGSPGAPGATHVFDVKGRYTLRVASVWQATVTMTGPGLTSPLPIAIGSAVLTSTRAYPVVEVRSVLVS
jgi:hypothetical protein